MNERIRELALQVGAVYSDDHAVSLLDDEIEKFAELIVKECIGVLEFPSAVKFNKEKLNELSEYNQGWVNGRKSGIEHLKEHFGVEE